MIKMKHVAAYLVVLLTVAGLTMVGTNYFWSQIGAQGACGYPSALYDAQFNCRMFREENILGCDQILKRWADEGYEACVDAYYDNLRRQGIADALRD